MQARLGAPVYLTPDQLPGHPASRVVGAVTRLLRARTMGELCDALGGAFKRDVIYDGPAVSVQRKGHLRLWLWALKALGSFDAEPGLVTVTSLGARTLLAWPLDVEWRLRRSLLLPATLLLPRRVEVAADVRLCVVGDLKSGQVEWLAVAPYNWPKLPGVLRRLLGTGLAAPLHATEPVWSLLPVWQWLGEPFYADKRRRAAEAGGGGAERGAGAAGTTALGGAAPFAGDEANDAAIDFASGAYSAAFGALEALLGRASGAASSAADAATSAARGATEGARARAARAAGAVERASQGAADAVVGAVTTARGWD